MKSPFTGGPAELKKYRPTLKKNGVRIRISSERWRCVRSQEYFQTPEQVQRELDLLDAAYARKTAYPFSDSGFGPKFSTPPAQQT